MYAKMSEQIETSDKLDIIFNVKIIHYTWVNNIPYQKKDLIFNILNTVIISFQNSEKWSSLP